MKGLDSGAAATVFAEAARGSEARVSEARVSEARVSEGVGAARVRRARALGGLSRSSNTTTSSRERGESATSRSAQPGRRSVNECAPSSGRGSASGVSPRSASPS